MYLWRCARRQAHAADQYGNRERTETPHEKPDVMQSKPEYGALSDSLAPIPDPGKFKNFLNSDAEQPHEREAAPNSNDGTTHTPDPLEDGT